jgi:hypothetical protein
VRLPSNEDEDDDFYDDEIVENARINRKDKKAEILSGWNNNRHPIFLN